MKAGKIFSFPPKLVNSNVNLNPYAQGSSKRRRASSLYAKKIKTRC